MSGWFRRFRPSPPSAGLGPCPSTLLSFFFSLAFSGFARSGLGVLVCVCSLLLLFRSPLRVLVKYFSSHLHSHLIGHPPFILIFISFFTRTTLPEAGCVCVCTVWRDVKLPLIILYYIIYGWGSPGSRGGRWSTKTPPRDLCKRTSGTVVVHLGAFKSQLVATIVPYIYIYIYNLN